MTNKERERERERNGKSTEKQNEISERKRQKVPAAVSLVEKGWKGRKERNGRVRSDGEASGPERA